MGGIRRSLELKGDEIPLRFRIPAGPYSKVYKAEIQVLKR